MTETGVLQNRRSGIGISRSCGKIGNPEFGQCFLFSGAGQVIFLIGRRFGSGKHTDISRTKQDTFDRSYRSIEHTLPHWPAVYRYPDIPVLDREFSLYMISLSGLIVHHIRET